MKKETGYKISVVTACYKSVPFLERIYSSLKKQSFKNIEWITVNDCSPDNTLAMLHQLKDKGELDMNIINLAQNTRAVGAMAEGIKHATGDFTLILDHDDELLDNAILPMLEIWDKMNEQTNTALYGIWGRCIDECGKQIGKSIESTPLIRTNAQLFHKYKLRGEWGISLFKTSVLKEFYVFENNIKGCTNGIIWNRMGQQFSSVLTNIFLRRYYTIVPGSMMQAKTVAVPRAMARQEAEYLNSNGKFFINDAIFFLKKIIIYLKYNYHSGQSLLAGISNLKDNFFKLLSVLLIPVFVYVVLRDKFFKEKHV